MYESKICQDHHFPMTLLYEILKNNILLVYCQSNVPRKWSVA